MTTTGVAQPIYPDPDSHIHDWMQDLSQELGNVGRDRPTYARRGIQLCRRVLHQFTGEGELFQHCFRADLGEFHLLDGDTVAGERELAALIADYPDAAAGYVRFSHALWRPGATRQDLQRALDLLQRAQARPVADAQHYDIENQIEHLRAEIVRLDSPDVPATESGTGTPDS